MGVISRFKSAWNAFSNMENPLKSDYSRGSPSYGGASPSRQRRRYSNERTIISSIYTRIGIDVSGVDIRHVKLDELGRYSEDADSHLNNCLKLEPNLDQGPRAFRQDLVLTLFDKGVAAIVPVDTTVDPNTTDIIDIYTLRVGEIVDWYPKQVKVSVYNEEKGIREDVILEKRFVAIVENPLYNVMNEPNSTLQRLIVKLSQLDAVDEASSSGKLDLIIQLPYVVKSEARKQQAQKRRDEIEFQLKGSQYGIAYTDGTEKVTQLNRPTENNLLAQVEFLVKMLYGQLGITEEVMNGTADEKAMINYIDRTIEPIADAAVQAMRRSFLGPVGIKRREDIQYFRNVFKLVPISELAEIADKFTRNEILSSNEFRGVLGIPPSADPKADELRNSNMPQPPEPPNFDDIDSVMNEVFDGLSADIEGLKKEPSSG